MDIYFDEKHDMTLKNGDIRFTEPDEDVKQRLTIYLQFLFGEWFLSTSEGVPYTQTIFELVSSDINLVYTILRNEIKNIEGVNTIDELVINSIGDEEKLSVVLAVNGLEGVEVII